MKPKIGMMGAGAAGRSCAAAPITPVMSAITIPTMPQRADFMGGSYQFVLPARPVSPLTANGQGTRESGNTLNSKIPGSEEAESRGCRCLTPYALSKQASATAPGIFLGVGVSAIGPKRTRRSPNAAAAFGGKADTIAALVAGFENWSGWF
jgi:hypothetical protein